MKQALLQVDISYIYRTTGNIVPPLIEFLCLGYMPPMSVLCGEKKEKKKKERKERKQCRSIPVPFEDRNNRKL